MKKFEGNPNIKKPDATQLDIDFEDTSKSSGVENEKQFVDDKDNNSEIKHQDNDEKEDLGNEYYGRFNKNKKRKTVPPSQKPKTQREKDDEKIRAIKRTIEKGKDKDRKTGYEHPDPWDMSR